MNIYTYGFWFYNELAEKVGVRPAKHHGDREDSYINLDTPNYGTFKVKASSFRLELFRQNPCCVSCHRKGSLWLLQAHHKTENPHLNLYHVEDHELTEWKNLSQDGLVLMTKDHIVPKSRGGANKWENFQTMCSICNGKKGDRMPAKFKQIVDPTIPAGVMENLGGSVHFI